VDILTLSTHIHACIHTYRGEGEKEEEGRVSYLALLYKGEKEEEGRVSYLALLYK